MSDGNLEEFARGMRASLRAALAPVTSQENRDAVARFVSASAERAAQAMALGDDALVREIQAQSRVFAEGQRVRLTEAKWEVFLAGVTGVFAAVLNLGLGAKR